MTQMSGGRNYDDGDGTEIIDFQRQFSQSQTVITTRSSNYLFVFYSLFPPRLHVTLVGFGGLGLEFQMLVPISSINRTCNEMKRCWMLFLGCFLPGDFFFCFSRRKALIRVYQIGRQENSLRDQKNVHGLSRMTLNFCPGLSARRCII